jgi:pimeloyl-ACP methyl ester carboxylesterase
VGLVLTDPTDPDGHNFGDMSLDDFVEHRVEAWTRLKQKVELGEKRLVPADASPTFTATLTEDFLKTPEARIRGGTRSAAQLRLGGRTRDLSIPTLMLLGDRLALDAKMETFAKLPTPRFLEILHDVGHASNVEAPREVAAVITRFLQRTLAGVARADV